MVTIHELNAYDLHAQTISFIQLMRMELLKNGILINAKVIQHFMDI